MITVLTRRQFIRSALALVRRIAVRQACSQRIGRRRSPTSKR